MGKLNYVSIWLMSFLNSLSSRLNLFFKAYRGQILIATLLFVLAAPVAVYAFDPSAGAQNVLSFIKFIIIIIVVAKAGDLLIKSEMVSAVVLVVIASIIYVVTDANMMKALGQGITNLVGMGDG